MRISFINNIPKNNNYYRYNNYAAKNKISFGQNKPAGSEIDDLIKKREEIYSLINKLSDNIRYVLNYSEKRAEADTRNKIEQEKRQGKTIEVIGKFITGESKDIENRNWDDFYNERNIVYYLRQKLKDMQNMKKYFEEYLNIIDNKLVDEGLNNNIFTSEARNFQKSALTNPKRIIINYSKLSEEFETISPEEIINIVDVTAKGTKEAQRKLLDIYIQKSNEHKQLPENSAETLALGKKLASMRKQMTEQNISFVPDAPESFANDEEKWKFINRALWETQKNEASTMDALDVFEKYGARIYQSKPYIDTLGHLSTCTSTFLSKNKGNSEAFNKVFKRYIDVYSKFATKDVIKGYSPDSRELCAMFKRHSLGLDKSSAIELINALKNLAVDRDDYLDLMYFFKNLKFGKGSLMPQLKETDLPDIQKALDEFALAVANLPNDIMKV